MVISSFSVLPEKFEFWQEFMKIENVLAVKMAPFDRYCTLQCDKLLHGFFQGGRIAIRRNAVI